MSTELSNGVVSSATDGTFAAAVLENPRPVLVEFWAEWCPPCRMVAPVLAEIAEEHADKIDVVKLNIDENPEIAQQMRIQSIPAVYAFKDGRPVDGFVGALPESQIKQFVQRVAGGKGGPSPIEEATTMAKEALQQGDHGTAAAIFSQILQREPANPEAQAGLARALIAAGDLRKARQTLDRVAKEHMAHAEIAAARAALDLAEQAKTAMASAGKLRARLAANPDDHEARFELATALFGSGEREAAIEELLTLYKRDREWNEQAARKQLVKFFEIMGGTDPLTLSARRRLSALMFS